MDGKIIQRIEAYKMNWGIHQKRELKWLDKYYALIRFKEQYGHINVPVSYDTKLFNWVQIQRQSYQINIMDSARIELLKLLGFKFRLAKFTKRNKWDDTFIKLKQFKEEFGHIKVTVRNKYLYAWLCIQRIHFKADKLDEEKIMQLTSLGFDLTPRDTLWNQKFQKLVNFKKQHGHFDINRKNTNDMQLINFVFWMRHKKDKISVERLKKLQGIGFFSL
jgi:hypothetical protein